MKTKRIQWEFGAAAILLFVIGWIVFAGSSASTGRPTEKTYAWLACQSFLTIAAHAAQENHSVFEISKLNADEKVDLLALSQSWQRGAGFFIKTNFIYQEPVQKPVIVSNWSLKTAKPTIWNFFQNNLAHLAGYSDGTIKPISPTEFSNLDLAGFVSAGSLTTNSEFNDFNRSVRLLIEQ